ELELGAPKGVRGELGMENTIALLEVWRVPDDIVDYGSAANRTQVHAAHSALVAYFRGGAAFVRGGLHAAEIELRRSGETGADFPFNLPALRAVVSGWRSIGRHDRAATLLTWLKERNLDRP